jgi:hypothetical protein
MYEYIAEAYGTPEANSLIYIGGCDHYSRSNWYGKADETRIITAFFVKDFPSLEAAKAWVDEIQRPIINCEVEGMIRWFVYYKPRWQDGDDWWVIQPNDYAMEG